MRIVTEPLMIDWDRCNITCAGRRFTSLRKFEVFMMSNLIAPHVTQDDDAPARRPENEHEAIDALQGMEDWGELERGWLSKPARGWYRFMRFMPGAAGALKPKPEGDQ